MVSEQIYFSARAHKPNPDLLNIHKPITLSEVNLKDSEECDMDNCTNEATIVCKNDKVIELGCGKNFCPRHTSKW